MDGSPEVKSSLLAVVEARVPDGCIGGRARIHRTIHPDFTGGRTGLVLRHQPETLKNAVHLMENYLASCNIPEMPSRGVTERQGDMPREVAWDTRLHLAPQGPLMAEKKPGPHSGAVRKDSSLAEPPAAFKGSAIPHGRTYGKAPEKSDQQGNSLPCHTPTSVPSSRKCFSCGQAGQFCRDCPYMEYDFAESRAHKKSPDKLIVPVWAKGKKIMELVDSGCNQTLMHRQLVDLRKDTEGTIFFQCVQET